MMPIPESSSSSQHTSTDTVMPCSNTIAVSPNKQEPRISRTGLGVDW